MAEQRHVKLFRNGRNQAVRIPVEFELPGDEAIMHRDGERLVIEPVRKRGLVALLKSMKPIEEAAFLKSTIPCRRRSACFDHLHAGHQHHLRPDQEIPRQGREADCQGGREQHLHQRHRRGRVALRMCQEERIEATAPRQSRICSVRSSVLPLEVPADAEYSGIRAGLEAAGKPIGGNDLLIAAHACAVGATVVTANTDEFKRVRGLKVENWLA